MDLTSTINAVQIMLPEAVADFQTHRNVNILCEQVRNEILSLMEAFLVPVIEKILCDPNFLSELKIGAGKMGLRFNGYRPTSIRLLTGNSLTILSPYFSKAASKRRPGPKSKKRQNGTGRHFGFDCLGFIGRCSTLLCPSFEIARQTLENHAINLNVKTIRRITMSLANETLPLRGQISLCDADHVGGKTVLVCIDGGRLRERRPKRGRKPKNQKRQGYHTEWKEPIQFVIHIVNPDGSISQNHLPIYDATMGDIDAAFDLVEIYLRALNISEAKRVVFCCDGARSYWKRTEPLAKKLGISSHHEVIDYTHAKQNLHEIVNKLPKRTPVKERNRITESWKSLLWDGKFKDLKKEIIKHIPSPKKRKEALAKFKNYFLRNQNRMQYSVFRSLKLPTGSGCVESAIRRVINLRMKSPGIFWKPETSESMLFLRSQLLSGRWSILTDNIFKQFRSLCLCN
jgi:hypothetical protein